jgi:toxin ParE1/3/4
VRLVWTQEAADDLEAIMEYISRDSPEAALRLARHLFSILDSLPSLPFRGCKRDEDGGRESVFVPWPYVAVYEVVGESIFVKAIRHTSRDRSH